MFDAMTMQDDYTVHQSTTPAAILVYVANNRPEGDDGSMGMLEAFDPADDVQAAAYAAALADAHGFCAVVHS